MPENVFRLMTVGLLFIIGANTFDSIEGAIIYYILGTALTTCGMVAWILERMERSDDLD